MPARLGQHAARDKTHVPTQERLYPIWTVTDVVLAPWHVADNSIADMEPFLCPLPVSLTAASRCA